MRTTYCPVEWCEQYMSRALIAEYYLGNWGSATLVGGDLIQEPGTPFIIVTPRMS